MVTPVEVQMGKVFPEYMSVHGFEALAVVDVKETVRSGPKDGGHDSYLVVLSDEEIGWLIRDVWEDVWWWETE